MVAEVFSGMIQGIEGQIVQIQADISNGLPNFYMTGYLSNEVKESKERVRTALHNIGIALPPKRISVNFAPADFRKSGTFFDLAVAVAILLAMNLIPETYVKNTLFIGEFFVSATRARDELYIVSQRYAYGSKGNGKNILDTRVQNRFLEEAVKAVIQK